MIKNLLVIVIMSLSFMSEGSILSMGEPFKLESISKDTKSLKIKIKNHLDQDITLKLKADKVGSIPSRSKITQMKGFVTIKAKGSREIEFPLAVDNSDTALAYSFVPKLKKANATGVIASVTRAYNITERERPSAKFEVFYNRFKKKGKATKGRDEILIKGTNTGNLYMYGGKIKGVILKGKTPITTFESLVPHFLAGPKSDFLFQEKVKFTLPKGKYKVFLNFKTAEHSIDQIGQLLVK